MIKVFMLLIYLAISLALYGGYKILAEGNLRYAESPFPLAESLAVEDHYLLADRLSQSLQPIDIMSSVENLPANFTKSGAGIISYQPHNTLSIKKKQLDKFSGDEGANNHEEHSHNPLRRMQRIRAP